MGEHDIHTEVSAEGRREFTRAILEDVRALELMIERGLFERGTRRIGAEQEMFILDAALRPANRSLDLLKLLTPKHFTPELGQFNLEANLSPQVLEGNCLSAMERELRELMGQAGQAAAGIDCKLLLAGILPTLELDDLGLDSMTPEERYYQLNGLMRELRGGEFRTHIKGIDELHATHDNVMLEACNTSFQIHFQVEPQEFARLYNVAQVVTAPVLAASVNSPVLLRKRLWHETRVALFQQSVDTRSVAHTSRGERARVSFGEEWVKDSVLEIFRDDIAKFRSLISKEVGESSLAILERGEVPGLNALRMHNGTVYRWNRPCYGISDGKPHLRIENRVLPAGPTILDEMAGAAFFFGLMCNVSKEFTDVSSHMSFSDAKANFTAAARYGLNSRMKWFGGAPVGADELILKELLPLAREGLISHGLDAQEVSRYLEVIEERVTKGRTGAQWALDSLANMQSVRPDERYRSLTAAMLREQATERPVHEWPLAGVPARQDIRNSYRTVGQVMSTELFTVHPEDLIDLAASVMDWEHLRHVPVEDSEGRLLGLVTYRRLLRLIGRGGEAKTVAVRDIMREAPRVVSPEMSTVDALEIMRSEKMGCLPVVKNDRLVGFVTESDFMEVAAGLLDEWLKQD